MALETLREIAIERSKKQPKMIDHLTEESPILDQLPFDASTHGLSHSAEALTGADGMSFVDLDAPLPTVSSESKLIKFDLALMGGKMTVAEDRAKQLGGHAAYFAKKQGPVLKQTGSNTERAIVFDNLRQYAIDKVVAGESTKVALSAGGSANANYSIIAVRFEEGVCSGLYDPQGFGNGTFFDIMAINGGNIYDIGSGVLGYGARLKSNLGWQIHGLRNVGAIVNIDIAAGNVPTSTQIDDLLADIRATSSGRTVLMMHKKVQNWMGRAFKDSKVRLRQADNNITTAVDAWEGVPMLNSYNLYDATEANVALS